MRVSSFMNMLQSKILANGSTTLPKPVREALGDEAGDRVCCVISEGGVQVVRARSVSELAGMLTRDGRVPVSLDKMQESIVHAATESGT